MGPRSVDVIYNQTALGQRCFIDISALVQRRLYIVLTLGVAVVVHALQGRIQGGGAHPARAPPPKIGKKNVFLAENRDFSHEIP
jgi:hypothetical protein